jgi:hypothetical protein
LRGRLRTGRLALGAWVGWLTPKKLPELPSLVRHEGGGALLEDSGEAGLGEDAASASTAASLTPSVPGVQAEDTLPEPLPGQARPDAKGRCPHPRQVPLNVPGPLHERQPTSHPVREQ